MKSKLKRIIVALLVLVVVAHLGMFFIGGAILSGNLFNPRFTVRDAERLLARDYDVLTNAVVYAIDGRIEDAIKLLQGRGYESIHTSSDDVSFLRWRNLRRGRGIIFSTNGVTPDALSHGFVRLVPLSVSGWYFYERN